jgi:5-methylcytosine-specific restriction enzyme subunit McrC
MLLYAWRESPHSPYWQMVNPEQSPSLDGLLASALSQLMQQRLRIGLGCNYIPQEQILRGVRGRIQITRSLKQRLFEKGQAACKFEQYTINAPKNQVIRSTLLHLAKMGDLGSNRKQAEILRHSLRWLVRTLDGIDLIEVNPSLIHRLLTERQDRDYRLMLTICNLIWQRQMPTEEDGHSFVSELERERLILHRLYEKFVANFYQQHLPEWRVKPQKTLGWHEKTDNSFLPKMKPDLILKEKPTGKVVGLDTKFTAKSLKENRWGKEMFNSSHLYQLYTYLGSQEHIASFQNQASGILLYPAVKDELSETIELPKFQMSIECVNLANEWEAIEQQLLELILNPSHSSTSL